MAKKNRHPFKRRAVSLVPATSVSTFYGAEKRRICLHHRRYVRNYFSLDSFVILPVLTMDMQLLCPEDLNACTT
jgi:hypothetical protein